MSPAAFCATLGGVGRLRPAPGTWGSAAALPLGWALHAAGGPWALAVGTLLAFGLGIWAVGQAGAGLDDTDSPDFVIDELVGQWIALLPVSFGAASAGVPFTALWPGILTAFLAFRLFDITKPWPANRFDARKDPLGVMADDVVAGVYAALAVGAAAALAHGLFLR